MTKHTPGLHPAIGITTDQTVRLPVWVQMAIGRASNKIDREQEINAELLAALKATLPALILLGNYIGNDWKGGGGIEAFDRCATILLMREAIAKAEGSST